MATSPKRRIRLTIEYDGRPFEGWQRQAHGPSVQGALEAALAKVLGHDVLLIGAGRTDAGVHALAMPAHFDTPNPMPMVKLPLAVVPYMPREIAIVAAEEVPRRFQARGGALLRWYRYQIHLGRVNHPLGARAWRVAKPLDLAKMRRALERLEGDHDFAGFRAAGCTAERTELSMREASLTHAGNLIALDLKCQSFLQRMVRLVAGAIVGVGTGKFKEGDIGAILKTGERPSNVRAAPADGLCLMRVAYTPAEVREVLAARPAPPSF